MATPTAIRESGRQGTVRNVREVFGSLDRPLLIFDSPVDQTVGIDNAALVYQAAR